MVALYLFSRLKKLEKAQNELILLFRDPKTVEDAMKVAAERKKLTDNYEKLAEDVEELKDKQSSCFDRVNIVRYCQPGQSEARMSYSVGLTNGEDDALVITGLSYRNGVNMYFKQVKDGESDYPLSEEEKEAISRNKLNEIRGK